MVLGRHKEGFLRSTLLEYIPGVLIRKNSPEDWEKMLFEAHAAVDSEHPELDYISVCAELDYYGCALFPVKVCCARRARRVALHVGGGGGEGGWAWWVAVAAAA